MMRGGETVTKPVRRWPRWMQALARYEAALDTTYDDIQDLRIERLQSELHQLQGRVASIAGNGPLDIGSGGPTAPR